LFIYLCCKDAVEPVRMSVVDDVAADDQVATVAASRRRGSVDGQSNAVVTYDVPPVDSVERRTVNTPADQLDHLWAGDAELISVTTWHARDACY